MRIATGNLLPADYPDTQITKKISAAYSKIQLAVGRTLLDPFISTDAEYDHAKQIEISLAAMYCLKAYGPEFETKIAELKIETDEDIAFLKENIQETADTGDVNILYAVTPYLSYGAAMDEDPTQTTIAPYRSGLTDDV